MAYALFDAEDASRGRRAPQRRQRRPYRRDAAMRPGRRPLSLLSFRTLLDAGACRPWGCAGRSLLRTTQAGGARRGWTVSYDGRLEGFPQPPWKSGEAYPEQVHMRDDRSDTPRWGKPSHALGSTPPAGRRRRVVTVLPIAVVPSAGAQTGVCVGLCLVTPLLGVHRA